MNHRKQKSPTKKGTILVSTTGNTSISTPLLFRQSINSALVKSYEKVISPKNSDLTQVRIPGYGLCKCNSLLPKTNSIIKAHCFHFRFLNLWGDRGWWYNLTIYIYIHIMISSSRSQFKTSSNFNFVTSDFFGRRVQSDILLP